MPDTAREPVHPGQKLKNGATLIAIKEAVRGNRLEHYVLCMKPNASYKLWVEYITWAFDTESGEAFWGHYYGDNFLEAVSDFEQRGT